MGSSAEVSQWYLAAVSEPRVPGSPSGGRRPVVAVIDSGIRADHEDLAGLVTRPACAPTSGPLDLGHGTRVAGLIAARADNGLGIRGLAPGTSILDIPILGATRGAVATDAQLAAAIDCAVASGADVVNISLSGPCVGGSPVPAAVDRALKSDVVIVAAAGNSAGAGRVCPASLPGVVAVTAVAADGSSGPFPSDATWIDIAAPGRAMVTTDGSGPGSYAVDSGTSYATPLVSAAAALLVESHPGWSPRRIALQLETTAAVPSRGSGIGVLDVAAALGRRESGFLMTTAEGRVTTGGRMAFRGDLTGLRLVSPVVDVAVTASGRGYWLVAADGGVFAFGDAPFLGSAAGLGLVSPVVDVAATASGRGYRMVAADGRVLEFGDAVSGRGFPGVPVPGSGLPVAGIDTAGRGYVVVGADGAVWGRSGAPSFAPIPVAAPVVAAVVRTTAGEAG